MDEPRTIASGHVYTDPQHRHLLRLFNLSALVSMGLLLVLIGAGIYIVFDRYIIRDAESDAVKIGNLLIEGELRKFVDAGTETTAELVIPEANLQILDQRLRRNLHLLSAPKIKVYAADKRILYSTDESIINEVDLQNRQLERALAGEVSSKLEKREELWDLDKERKLNRDMVETYLPITNRQGHTIGAFEIYLDVSAYRAEMKRVLVLAILAVFLILGAVFGVLMLLMRRATDLVYSTSQRLRVLSGLLPICSACKKIRDEQGHWEMLEKYITERSESAFTHSLCPDCLKQHWPE